MWLEVLSAAITNVVKFGSIIGFLSIAILAIITICHSVLKTEVGALSTQNLSNLDRYDREKISALKVVTGLKTTFMWLTIAGTVCIAIPSMDEVWKARIGMIKFQLASRENIEKGSEVIERIGKKLECKYLGCEEEVKKGAKNGE